MPPELRFLLMHCGFCSTSGGPLEDLGAHLERLVPAMISLDHCNRQRHLNGHRREWRFIAMLCTAQ